MKRSFGLALFLVLCVTAASAQTITVTRPAAGETVIKGRTYTVTWTMTGTLGAQVRISLRDAADLNEVSCGAGGAFNGVFIDSAPNTGSYAVPIPTCIPEGTYRIRVKVKNQAVYGDSGIFILKSGPAVVQAPLRTSQAPGLIAIKFPALVIYQAGMVPYDDKFEVTFGYKNSGTGDLPKNSDMPVKPTFRVLVDNRQVNQGNLVIPAFPAPPGWEMPTFFACEIARQTSGPFDPTVFEGNQLAIYINENKVNGMASSSQTYSLRSMALLYSYDIGINDVTLDWNSGNVTALIRLEGVFQPNDEITLWDDNLYHYPGYPWWHATAKAVPGQTLYTLSAKRDNIKSLNDLNLSLEVSLTRASDPGLLLKDIDHRNNSYKRVFHR